MFLQTLELLLHLHAVYTLRRKQCLGVAMERLATGYVMNGK